MDQKKLFKPKNWLMYNQRGYRIFFQDQSSKPREKFWGPPAIRPAIAHDQSKRRGFSLSRTAYSRNLKGEAER